MLKTAISTVKTYFTGQDSDQNESGYDFTQDYERDTLTKSHCIHCEYETWQDDKGECMNCDQQQVKTSSRPHKKLHLVINFSGGKDSCAVLHELCTRYPDTPKSVVFADTGWEHEGIIKWCINIVSRYGLKLHVVKSSTKDFISMVRDRGMFPSASYRQCTSDLKRAPIQKWIRNNIDTSDGTVIVNCMGIRAQESHSRRKQPRLQRRKGECNSIRTVWQWQPIKDWLVEDVMSCLKGADLPLHPAYEYLPRLSCRMCIFNSNKEIVAIKENDPETFRVMSDLEEEIGHTMKMEYDKVSKNSLPISLKEIVNKERERLNAPQRKGQ